jgi:hypothetical protein
LTILFGAVELLLATRIEVCESEKSLREMDGLQCRMIAVRDPLLPLALASTAKKRIHNRLVIIKRAFKPSIKPWIHRSGQLRILAIRLLLAYPLRADLGISEIA